MLDPRFAEKESVREFRIQAVLCAPVGGERPMGVVYLQDRAEGTFTPQDRDCLELFAAQLAPLAARILQQVREEEGADPTRPFRERMAVEGLEGRSAALARVLAGQVEGYADSVAGTGEGFSVYDDSRGGATPVDPRERLAEAVLELEDLAVLVGSAAMGKANSFWNAIGHIGAEPTRTEPARMEPVDGAPTDGGVDR